MLAQKSFSENYNQKAHPVNPIEYLKDRNVSTIFRFILTHPDMDHMDRIKELFNTFEVINFWDTENTKVMDDDSDWGRYDEADWDFYQEVRTSYSSPKVLNLYAGQKGKYYNQTEDGKSGADGLYLLAPTMDLVEEANKSKDYNDCSYVILYRTGMDITMNTAFGDKQCEFFVNPNQKFREKYDTIQELEKRKE